MTIMIFNKYYYICKTREEKRMTNRSEGKNYANMKDDNYICVYNRILIMFKGNS